MHYREEKQLQKKKKKKQCGHFSTAHMQKSSVNSTVVGLNDNRGAVCIASSQFSEPKRFVRRLDKVEGKYIQGQQPN